MLGHNCCCSDTLYAVLPDRLKLLVPASCSTCRAMQAVSGQQPLQGAQTPHCSHLAAQKPAKAHRAWGQRRTRAWLGPPTALSSSRQQAAIPCCPARQGRCTCRAGKLRSTPGFRHSKRAASLSFQHLQHTPGLDRAFLVASPSPQTSRGVPQNRITASFCTQTQPKGQGPRAGDRVQAGSQLAGRSRGLGCSRLHRMTIWPSSQP